MKHAPGFSLIECLIYCALLAMISMLVFGYFTRQSYALGTFIAASEHSMEWSGALQILAADIVQADSSVAYWHISREEFIWRMRDCCVAWRWHENNLYRTKGVYDFTRQKWERKSSALIARHITAFAIQTQVKNGSITTVAISAESNWHRYNREVPLMNRVLG